MSERTILSPPRKSLGASARIQKRSESKTYHIFAKKQDLHMQKAVENKPLFMHLFDLPGTTDKATTDKIIDSFVQ